MNGDYYEYDDPYAPQIDHWKCPLCSAENTRGESTCRFCQLPYQNECTGCRRAVGKTDRFCKYCGSATVYFQTAVFDPQERSLAGKDCRKTFSYWRRQGVRYLNIEDEYYYVQQLRNLGEIVVDP